MCITAYEHVQTVAAQVWTVTHNLNTYPVVDVLVYDNGSLVKIIPLDILFINMNTVEIRFSSNRTGQARLL